MSSKRELNEPHEGDKRYARRNKEGEFTEMDEQHRSLSQDDQHNAAHTSQPGHGDEGDGHTGNRKPAKK